VIKELFLFVSVAFLLQPCLAGGDSAKAKIVNFERRSDKTVLVEIKWQNEKGFIADNNETKLRFQFHKWPKESTSFLFKIISTFYDPFERDYPLVDFNESIDYLELKYKNNENLNLGQMGTVKFRKDEKNPDQIVIPFAKILKEHDGELACYLYAAPI
jgi:hypothetical protein